MKKLIYCLLPIILFSSCSVKPYLRITDLPKGINYYSNDKQFIVHPDWYWKLRPSLERGSESVTFEYLKQLDPGYKNENVKVIGEVVYKQNKFYVALWQSHGYYFIKEKDYIFAQKYKKYLVPIEYDAGSYLYGYSNMTEFEKITLLEKYFGNLKGKKYKIYNALYLLQNSIFEKPSFVTPQIKQYFSSNGYSNDFIELNNCPLFYEFCKNEEAFYSKSWFASIFLEPKQYTNNYGMLFQGYLYAAVYVIIPWGDVYYALPYEPYDKGKGIQLNE